MHLRERLVKALRKPELRDEILGGNAGGSNIIRITSDGEGSDVVGIELRLPDTKARELDKGPNQVLIHGLGIVRVFRRAVLRTRPSGNESWAE